MPLVSSTNRFLCAAADHTIFFFSSHETKKITDVPGNPQPSMYPILVPASGCTLLFAGFSTLGFAFASVYSSPGRSNAEKEAITYYVFNGAGILMALMAALPLQCAISRCRIMTAMTASFLATVFFIVSLVFGILENYAVYDENSSPTGGALYFLSWITSVCSVICNGVLFALATLALCMYADTCEGKECGQTKTIRAPRFLTGEPEVDDIEIQSTKRKIPKSRVDIGK